MLFRRSLIPACFGIAALLISESALHADVLAIGSTSLSLAQTSVNFLSLNGPNAVDLGTSTGAFAGSGGSTGTLQSISAGSLPISDFLAIPALPQAQFTLTSIGPGSPNANCVGLVAGGSCSASLGSPFVLTAAASGTVISFSAFGTVKDSSGITTGFTATFSTEVAGQSPSALQTRINTGGTVQSPFSASINVPSGMLAGTLNIGLSSISLASSGISFSLSNVIGPASTGTFAALSGTTATLKNVMSSLPVSNFLTIAGLSQVSFTLTSIGPGSSNANCVGLVAGGSCSASLGSPFVLTAVPLGTVVSFSALGTALDSSTNVQTFFEAIFPRTSLASLPETSRRS
jgi:hypothetical protein